MVNQYLAPCPVIPQFLLISAITNAYPMVVTVTEANGYVVGQLAYFSIPSSYGMFQLNALIGDIVAVNGLNLSFNIDSSLFDIFVIPSASAEQPASLSPAGSRNIYNVTEVPFHSEGNFGN